MTTAQRIGVEAAIQRRSAGTNPVTLPTIAATIERTTRNGMNELAR
jgi:hypothetical protein